eukprot:s27_g36.t1
MKRLGQAWKTYPANQKAEYHAKSKAEFQAQRDALLALGIVARGSVAKASCSGSPKADPHADPTKLKPVAIGPYEVHMEHKGDVPVLGCGSYGKVFLATGSNGRKRAVKVFSSNGRKRAVKVFSGHRANIEASFEIYIYQKLATLPPSEQHWFPSFCRADAKGQP